MGEPTNPKATSESSSSKAPDQDHESPKKPADAGWIERLAKRSAGLPVEGTPAEQPAGDRTLWSYAGLGIQFAGTIALFTWMGYELDRRMGSTPWWTLSLALVAIIGGLYLLIKELVQSNEPGPPKKPGRDK